ncbi:MAG: hypothetical protein K9K93_05180 [Acholeplasmataceae bacterium]|nr:hypothetical protein [Acholeplasmataceae bacterium]
MKKTLIIASIFTLFITGFVFAGFSVNASAVDTDAILETLETDDTGAYLLEDMLIVALTDEILAKATYESIIETFGEIRPFTKIVLAEQTHIDLLLPLFETYGIDLPDVDVTANPVYDSVSEALAVGVEAEIANIAIYEAFLAQDLPDDVRTAFELLMNASNNHLKAFSRDRMFGAGYDLANGFKKMFKHAGANGQQGTGGYQGVCPNVTE